MTQIKHILVPTDGSESALRAAEFAGLEARKHDADVTILIVHDEAPLALPAMAAAILPGSTSYTPFPREEAIKHIEEAAEKGELQETTQRLGDVPGTVTRVQLWGDAAKIICEYAAANDVDLIVIGRRGRSGFKNLVLGGVSSHVVNHAPCAATVTH